MYHMYSYYSKTCIELNSDSSQIFYLLIQGVGNPNYNCLVTFLLTSSHKDKAKHRS